MSLKANIGWNILLTLSGYILPLLSFPYVTRVLGAENLGLVNYILSYIDYAILFSTLGMTTVGIRYISQCGEDKRKINNVFSNLVSLHLLLSIIVLIIYLVCIFFIPFFSEFRLLYLIGATKIILNVFLVEWLFQGMQNFRYITIRSVFIRLIYIIGIFLFVRNSNDYDIYFYLTIAQVFINAIINWHYARNFISFKISINGIKEYLFPVLSLGINAILLSTYTTFNVLYLGTTCDTESVGYYTTATKLYAIFISLITAYNGVFVPHLNSLYAAGNIELFRKTISNSISLIIMVALPTITVGICLAPEIIRFIAGSGYDRSILPFQIVILLVLLVGISQILENQVLLSFKKFKEILYSTISTTILTIIIIVCYTPYYAEVAAACALTIPHVFEILILLFFVHRTISIPFSYRNLLNNVLSCIPIYIICELFKKYSSVYYFTIIGAIFLSAICYFAIQYFIVKEPNIIAYTDKFLLKIYKKKS